MFSNIEKADAFLCTSLKLRNVSLQIYFLQSYVLIYEAAKLLQSCPTLCNPTDYSPPGSAGPGILQARTLEWVATSFSSA